MTQPFQGDILAVGRLNFLSVTARHFFCKVCGIYPFHRKRGTPDNLGINVFFSARLRPRRYPGAPSSRGSHDLSIHRSIDETAGAAMVGFIKEAIYAGLAALAAGCLQPAIAMTFEACAETVQQKYINKCHLGMGNCTVSGCTVKATCDRNNGRCESSLSGGTWSAAAPKTIYCASPRQYIAEYELAEVVQALCKRQLGDADRAALMDSYAASVDRQHAESQAIAETFAKIAEAFAPARPTRSTGPQRPAPNPFEQAQRGDRVDSLCTGIAVRHLRQADAAMLASYKQKKTFEKEDLSQYQKLKASFQKVCKCAAENAQRQFTDTELADTASRTKLWGNIERSRLDEVFGPCRKLDESDSKLSWLVDPIPLQAPTRGR